MSYASVAFKFFGGVSKSIKPSFADMKETMQKAGLRYTVEEYLSITLFTTTVTFVIEAIALSFIFGLFFGVTVALLLALMLSLAISGILFFLFYSYPSTAARSRNSKIKKILPFVVSYMATMSSSRVPPIVVFKTLSEFKEYGEVSKEAENITRNVEVFGMTTSAAIKKQAKTTPSADFRELLWGINTIVTSGGDLTSYLSDKTNEFMNDYRRRIRKYSQDLSLYVEIYLTLIITGSIFFIVLSSVISALSQGIGTVLVQSFVVFVLLPLISIGFIVLVKSTSPLE